jgi:hypothetical protein
VKHMRRLLLVVLAAVAVLASAAQAAPLTDYPVPTGGFTVGLPPAWVDVTAAALAKAPSGSLTSAVSSSGALKLIAADPATNGHVYMDAGVARVGAVTAPALASANLKEIQLALGSKGTVTMSPFKLPVGQAYRLRFRFTQATASAETVEYLFVRNQIEYVVAYVAPTASWAKYEALFEQSARSFRFLAGPDLSHTVLTGAQIGPGYKLKPYPAGDSFIGTVTLDLCAASYPSESMRTGRLQVGYSHPAKSVGVSNEVVTYAKGGAQLALGEIRAVAASCARKHVVREQSGVTTTYRVSLVKAANLLPGSVAVRVTTTSTDGKRHATQAGIAIYQVKGNTFSGVYTFVTAGTTMADATRVGFHAAEQSARTLGGLALSA